MSQTPRRHIGDVLNMLVYTSAMCIRCDDIADGLAIHRRPITDARRCSRAAGKLLIVLLFDFVKYLVSHGLNGVS